MSNKLIQTPNRYSRQQLSEESTVATDIHQNCYSRVALLTQEIEKLSDVLSQKGEESDLLIEANAHLTIEKQQLAQELQVQKNDYVILSEKLKNKTNENEILLSKLHRVQEFTLKEYETKFFSLTQQVSELNAQLNIRDLELIKAKDEFARKTQEVAESLQQQFHLESQFKLLEQAKLTYIHEYQEKEKEVQQLNKKIESNEDYKLKYENLLLDIDTIRKNYSDLLEQKLQEKQELQEQLQIQRQMSDYALEDIQKKYAEILEIERTRIKQEYDERIETITCQCEGLLSTLNNLLQAKSQALESMQNQKQIVNKELVASIAADQNAKDDLIMELKAQNEATQKIFEQTSKELNEWNYKLLNGQICNTEEKQILEQTINDLNEKNKQMRIDNEKLANQCELLAKSYESLALELKHKEEVLQKLEQSVEELQNSHSEKEKDKINYLLYLIDEKDKEIGEKQKFIYQLQHI